MHLFLCHVPNYPNYCRWRIHLQELRSALFLSSCYASPPNRLKDARFTRVLFVFYWEVDATEASNIPKRHDISHLEFECGAGRILLYSLPLFDSNTPSRVKDRIRLELACSWASTLLA